MLQDARLLRAHYVRWAAALTLALFCLVVGCGGRKMLPTSLGDFRAFYCAGQVLALHQDPYAVEPMRHCEMPLNITALIYDKRAPTNFVLPAPLPGYSIAAFRILAIAPYPVAAVLWTAILLSALAISVVLLAKILELPRDALFVAFSISVLCISVYTGEIVPLALAGVCLAAYGAQRSQNVSMAAGLLLTMSEPQIGLALAIALIALRRRNIVTVAAVFAALAVFSLIATGLEQNIRYVTVILPEHVASELHASFQYSFSWLATQAGVPDAYATAIGRITYAIALVLAFVVGTTMRKRNDVALGVLAAPALAVCGGPFLHLDHIALALPASLYLATRTTGTKQLVATIATVALEVPVVFTLAHPLLLFALPPVVAWLCSTIYRSTIAGFRAATIATAYVAVIAVLASRAGMVRSGATSTPTSPADLASTPWAAYVRMHAVSSWIAWAAKIATWFGLIATAVMTLRTSLTAKPAAGDDAAVLRTQYVPNLGD